MAEALRMAQDAVESWLEAADAAGEEWPAPSSRVTASSGEIVFWVEVDDSARQRAA